MTKTLNVKELLNSNIPDEYMYQKKDTGYTDVVFADNVSIQVPTRMLLLNIIFWEPNISFGILPESSDFFNIKSITTDSISVIQTKMYKKALKLLPNVPYMQIVMKYLYNIDRLSNFIQRHMGIYMPSIDALGLARLMENPALKKLADYQFDDRLGTKVAEQKLKAMSKELITHLKDPNLPNNCLFPYMQAGTLKSNQIPQFLIAYGPRSDVDDTMKKHIVSQSSFSGLKTVEDFAIESLSAKKSIYFSRDVIRQSQYSGRKMRLACAEIQYIYPGSCGSQGWMPYVIHEDVADNYIDRIVIDDKGNRVLLDKQNISKFLERPIKLVSQFACRHTDGICEHCAGYGEDMLIKYMPPDIHIGLLSSSKVSSVVSQKILSAKHLVSTSSKLYTLPESAQKYMYKVEDAIFWNEDAVKYFDNVRFRVPNDSINQISDLNLDTLPNAESYSKIPFIEIVKDDEVVDRICLEADVFIPYFSTQMLEHLHNHYRQIKVDDEYTTFTMSGYDIKQPFMKFVILNDDMITYTKRVYGFLGARMINYTTVASCLRDFSSVVYQKSSINSFFIETVIRSHMIASETDFRIPVVTDFDNVHFGNLADVISETSVSGKLAFENLKQYLTAPSTPLLLRKRGLFAPYFGLI